MIIKIFLIFILLMVFRPTLTSIRGIKNSVQVKPKIENITQKPQFLSSAKPEGLVISLSTPKVVMRSYNPSEKENPDNFIEFFPTSGSPVVMDTSSGTSSIISVHIFPPII